MTNDLGIFFKEVWEEFKKISWPSRKDFLMNVAGVLFIVFLFSIYLGFLDGLIGFIISKLIFIFL